MRTLLIAVGFVLAGSMIAEAQRMDRTVTRTGPNGQPLVLKLDGKYSTCIRDSQRLGYAYASAKRYCDAKPRLKR